MAILNPFRIGQGVLGQQLGPYPYGALNSGQVPYWDGNEFKIPGFTPQPWVYTPPAASAPSAPSADSQSNPNAGILAALTQGGDGGAGNTMGGGREVAAPGVVAPEVQEQGIPAGYGLGIVSPVSVEPSAPTAPAPGLAPAPGMQDLAVTEVDPQGPSGKGKGKTGPTGMTSQQAANQAATQAATANTAAAIATVDKALQENPTSFMDAVKSAMQATAQGIGLGVSEGISPGDTTTGAPGGFAPGHDKESKDYGGGTDTNGGPGSSGASGTSGTGPNAGDEGGLGAWRKGGFVGDDGDRKLEPVKGILHEREFVLTPEVTAAIQKKSPGLLHRLAKMQKMMAA